MITDDMLLKETPHRFLSGIQRLYKLPNNYGLSLLNSKELHDFEFAWEAAVIEPSQDSEDFGCLSYDTPLTDDVEVFYSDEEANAFIEKAKLWAQGEMK